MPGGWAVTNLYERKAIGQIDQKNDKMWPSAVEESSDACKMKGREILFWAVKPALSR